MVEDSGSSKNLRIGGWSVYPAEGLLARDGERVRLRPKTMGLLVRLAAHPGRTVDKEALLRSVWPDTVVADGGLSHCVSELRGALGDDPRQPRFIETVPRRGYRLIAWVEILKGDAARPPRDAEPEPEDAEPVAAAGAAAGRHVKARWPALAVAALVTVALSSLALRGRPATSDGAPLERAPARHSVESAPRTVVLGLANLSGDPDAGWLGDALAYALSAELATTRNLSLVPWDVLAGLQTEISSGEVASPSAVVLRRLGGSLGVERVVSGHYSLSPGDGAPRVEVTVTDAGSGTILGTAEASGRRDRLDELASRLAHGLGAALGWSPRRDGEQAAEHGEGSWHEDYFRGRWLLAQYRGEEARKLLERAASTAGEPWPRLALAELRSRTGHRDQAASDVDIALAAAGRLTGAERLWFEARAHTLVERWPGAIERLMALRIVMPETLEVDLRLVSSYLTSDRPEDAEAMIAEVFDRSTFAAGEPRARLLAGRVHLALGRPDEALAEAGEAARLARELGAGGVEGRALYLEARGHATAGRARQAMASLDAARRSFAAAHDRSNEAAASNLLADWLTRAGEHARAREAAGNALRISRTTGDHLDEADALRLLGYLEWKCGRRQDGESALHGALEILEHIAAHAEQARVWITLADAVQRFTEEPARPFLEEALAIYRQLEDRKHIGWMLFRLGRESLLGGDLAPALAALNEAEELADALDPARRARLMLFLGHGRLWAGDLYRARAAIETAERLSRQVGDDALLATALEQLGFARMLEADLESAIRYQRQSLSILEELGEERRLARSRQGLARMLLETGDLAAAERLARQAVEQTAPLPASEEIRHLTLDALARVQVETGRAGAALTTLAELPDRPLSAMSFVALSCAVTRARALAAAGDTEAARALLDALAEHLDGRGPTLLQLDTELEQLRMTRSLARHPDSAPIERLASRARGKGLMLLAGKVESLL